MAGTFLSLSIGGPALVYWLSPTEEELFLKYNPDLQKRSLENRIGKQQDFDNFVGKLKEYSKSDRPSRFLWFVGRRRKR
jgi:CBP4